MVKVFNLKSTTKSIFSHQEAGCSGQRRVWNKEQITLNVISVIEFARNYYSVNGVDED